jgi:hypothetical protein
MDKIKQKVEEGWMHCIFIIEMLGKPKEHLEKTLKGYIITLKKDKKVKILKEEYAEPEKDKDSKLYTIFVELEVLINGATKVVDFCFDYLPSSVEILDPTSVEYQSQDFSSLLNDLLARLHQIDMALKNSNQENTILKKNSAIFLRNIIYLSLKQGKKKLTELSKDSGVPEQDLDKFLGILIKEKKLKMDKKSYSLS